MLRAIDTQYAGCLFRSRLEARWAVFFDHLLLEWRYEPQGFVLDDSEALYLPDFWLPKQQIWVEVKGIDDPDGVNRWRQFSRAIDPHWAEDNDEPSHITAGDEHSCLRGRSFLTQGDIPDPRRLGSGELAQADAMYGSGGLHYYWTRCPQCGAIGATWHGRAERLPCRCVDNITPQAHHRRLLYAYRAARSARFEHEDREHWSAA